jgi:hypothetical protein
MLFPSTTLYSSFPNDFHATHMFSLFVSGKRYGSFRKEVNRATEEEFYHVRRVIYIPCGISCVTYRRFINAYNELRYELAVLCSDNRPATQEISLLVLDLKLQYRVCMGPPFVPSITQMNPLCTLSLYLDQFNIILLYIPRSSK